MAAQCKALPYAKNEALHRHLCTGAKVQRCKEYTALHLLLGTTLSWFPRLTNPWGSINGDAKNEALHRHLCTGAKVQRCKEYTALRLLLGTTLSWFPRLTNPWGSINGALCPIRS
jgi:hypothetical protein